jgi:hypothetical protein
MESRSLKEEFSNTLSARLLPFWEAEDCQKILAWLMAVPAL